MKKCSTVMMTAVCVALAAFPGSAVCDWKEIVGEIRGRLERLDPPLGPGSLEVEYRNDSSVVLRGSVASSADRRRAEAVALGTTGVSRVENQLIVDERGVTASSHDTSPRMAEAARLVQSSIETAVTNASFRVNVEPRGSVLVITGVVDSQLTRERVVKAARQASTAQIEDALVLQAPIPDEKVRQSVVTLVEDQYPLISTRISVSVLEGQVTLTGDLDNHWQVDKVLASVLMVEGVSGIDSAITINGMPYSSSGRLAKRE